MNHTAHQAQPTGFETGFEAGHKFGWDHAPMLTFFLVFGLLMARALRRRRRD